MQNNVHELTRRLLRSIDNSYNVIDMPAVIEIVSLLEKVPITKELLEATRLGKHVNELRRKTDNDSLSKRAKELVKKWRNMILPPAQQTAAVPHHAAEQVNNGQAARVPPPDDHSSGSRKRPITSSSTSGNVMKRPKINNGTTSSSSTADIMHDFSDNSNSSCMDRIVAKNSSSSAVITINSDSNSSFPDSSSSAVAVQQSVPSTPDVVVVAATPPPTPKKRGRKKGSKNHKSLLDEAESSFSNKLAVSRGANSKVKTTQELIAGLANRGTGSAGNAASSSSPVKSGSTTPNQDLSLRAAMLTERVSIIDQKLNTNANRYKNSSRVTTKIKLGNTIIESSGSVINDKNHRQVGNSDNDNDNDEDVVVVDDPEPPVDIVVKEETTVEDPSSSVKGKSLSIEEALSRLPPIDTSCLYDDDVSDVAPPCSCALETVDDRLEWSEDPECARRAALVKREGEQCRSCASHSTIYNKCAPNIDGNWAVGGQRAGPQMTADGLFVNVVPKVEEFSGENYKKYSISEAGCSCNNNKDSEVRVKSEMADRTDGGDRDNDDGAEREDNSDKKSVFREWHECADVPSYDGEIFRILPYVIID